jgi:hypothetical protein
MLMALFSPDDPVWEAGDMRPAEPIHVEGRLSAAGSAPVLFQRTDVRRVRDAVPALSGGREVEVSEEEHFIFSAEGEEGSDDPDVFPVQPERLLARHDAGSTGSVASGSADVRTMPRRLQGALPERVVQI